MNKNPHANIGRKHCVPCEEGGRHLMADELQTYMKEVKDWKLIDYREIKKEFKFKNFAEALAFVNKVGALAESEVHHPDIAFGWGYVTITLFTHAVGGLSENDFIMAAKIDALSKVQP